MTKEAAKKQIALIDKDMSIEHMKTRADLLIKSGLLPAGIKTAEQAIVVMLTGAEYGIPMMKSFQVIDVIEGRPSLKPQLLLALCKNTGELQDVKIESYDTYCRVTLTRKGMTPHMVIFGDEDAKRMLTRSTEWVNGQPVKKVVPLIEKYNYKTMKKDMYVARAVGRACKYLFADAVLGLYCGDEANDVYDEVTEHKIEAKAEIAEAAIDKTAAIEVGLDTGSVHDEAAEMEFISKVGASFIQDERFYNYYPDKSIGEIYQDQTPAGKQKGADFLRQVSEVSSNADDRANISKYLEILGRK